MAASSTFESSLRGRNPTRKTTPSSSESWKRPATERPRRSRSVSVFSRTSHSDFSDFSNPLFEKNNDDDEGTEFRKSDLKSNEIVSKTKHKAISSADDNGNRRGRSISRNDSDGKHTTGLGNSKKLLRSLSVVDTNSRGRSVSRTPLSRSHYTPSESDMEQEGNLWKNSRKKGISSATSSNGKKNSSDRGRSSSTTLSQRKQVDPSNASSTKLSRFKTSKWDDAASRSSFSDAELMELDNMVGDHTADSDICKTSKSEVRQNIFDIQNDLESSQERARQLRADLAVEEHRGMELSRILKEVLPDEKTPSSKKSRLGRKFSNERRRISKSLTEEALAYFDECVSLSTFDGSDFSSIEDPPLKLVGPDTLDGDNALLPYGSSNITDSNDHHHKQECQLTCSHDPTDLTASKSNMEQTQDEHSLNNTDGIEEWSQRFRFSFSPSPGQIRELQHDIKKYVKGFEKSVVKVEIDSQVTRRYSNDLDEYDLQSRQQSLLFDHVFFKNRLESGGLLLCHGGCIASSSLPFASVI